MTLIENAFALLDAEPTDDRKTLIEKADEKALLGGENTEAVLGQLMQMNRRIFAEVSWFPDSAPQASKAFLDYARKVSEGKSAKIPSMDGLGNPLAQANALSAFFSIWPADDTDFFKALGLAMDNLISQIRYEEVFQAINSDRQAGGWETIRNVEEIREPLDEHIRELCQPLMTAMEKMDTDTLSTALQLLYRSKDFDAQGELAQAVNAVYGVRIHSQAEKLKQEILFMVDGYLFNNFSAMKQATDKWDSLTYPLRKSPGQTRNDAFAIGSAIRNSAVEALKRTSPVTKERQLTFRNLSGTKRVTITYQSRREAIDKARDITSWLIRIFPEQTDLKDTLNSDREQLDEMIREEDQRIKRMEEDAEKKYGGWF